MANVVDTAHRRDLAAVWRLFRAFRTEQTDPVGFYTVLAEDSVAQLAHYEPLAGRLVLDVGGGPGLYADAFARAGARYLSVDHDLGELVGARLDGTPSQCGSAVAGDAQRLPIGTGAVDVCYSSNVLEHVPRPESMVDEMVRVTRPGGLVFCSFTNWLSPHGGHETGPWHYLGGEYAARRYARRQGREPRNRFGSSLFDVSVARGLRMAAGRADAELVDAFPRYHPGWARGVVRIPVVREFATWNLVTVLRKR
jgi:SAM-dependent methyltransferase